MNKWNKQIINEIIDKYNLIFYKLSLVVAASSSVIIIIIIITIVTKYISICL